MLLRNASLDYSVLRSHWMVGRHNPDQSPARALFDKPAPTFFNITPDQLSDSNTNFILYPTRLDSTDIKTATRTAPLLNLLHEIS